MAVLTQAEHPHAHISNLYCAHHRWLVGWLRRRLGCADSAQDLAQDTFLRILNKPQPLADVREPRAWLTRIAHGLMVDQVRRRDIELSYEAAVAHLPEQEVPSAEARMIILETLAHIDALLDGLHPHARTAFLLSRLEGLKYTEIAAHMKLSLSSVEKHMATAVRQCLMASVAP